MLLCMCTNISTDQTTFDSIHITLLLDCNYKSVQKPRKETLN